MRKKTNGVIFSLFFSTSEFFSFFPFPHHQHPQRTPLRIFSPVRAPPQPIFFIKYRNSKFFCLSAGPSPRVGRCARSREMTPPQKKNTVDIFRFKRGEGAESWRETRDETRMRGGEKNRKNRSVCVCVCRPCARERAPCQRPPQALP